MDFIAQLVYYGAKYVILLAITVGAVMLGAKLKLMKTEK